MRPRDRSNRLLGVALRRRGNWPPATASAVICLNRQSEATTTIGASEAVVNMIWVRRGRNQGIEARRGRTIASVQILDERPIINAHADDGYDIPQFRDGPDRNRDVNVLTTARHVQRPLTIIYTTKPAAETRQTRWIGRWMIWHVPDFLGMRVPIVA